LPRGEKLGRALDAECDLEIEQGVGQASDRCLAGSKARFQPGFPGVGEIFDGVPAAFQVGGLFVRECATESCTASRSPHNAIVAMSAS
jgi:hypothetical protein